MNDKTKAVTVNIMGKEYKVACPSGEHESLVASAKEVDTRMRSIRKGGKVLNADRIGVLVALNLAHELLNAQTQVDNIDSDVLDRIDQLQTRIHETMETCATHDNQQTH
ncbi:MAG: cell division protein ZapA [Thiotrichaceae bacterium]